MSSMILIGRVLCKATPTMPTWGLSPDPHAERREAVRPSNTHSRGGTRDVLARTSACTQECLHARALARKNACTQEHLTLARKIACTQERLHARALPANHQTSRHDQTIHLQIPDSPCQRLKFESASQEMAQFPGLVRSKPEGRRKEASLTQSINSRVGGSQLPHKIVNLMFNITS